MIIKVKITPNSRANQVIGFEQDTLKIKIKAPAEKGKANKELISFLAKKLKIAKSSITILTGQTSRLKKLKIESVSIKNFTQLIVNK
ncbi:MAG: hypothetical protein KR126chlam6_00439 [Candidatus Anoxychlamydiales bacterium]|nr:hypothetical protein [Candidatus Anoxychlamydiales bacterium]